MKYILTLLIILSLTLIANETNELERAYAKEFAYLKAQKKMLKERLSTVENQNFTKIKNAKIQIETLQNVVLQKNISSESLENKLFHSQQNALVMNDDTALLESVLMQSTTMLKSLGKEIQVDEKNYQKSLEDIFIASDTIIRELSSIIKTNGNFYVEDGTQKKATIIKIGNIASYGISDEISGALVPAGENRLKLWNSQEAAQSAKSLQNNSIQEDINIFIYENSNKEVDNIIEKSAIDIINSGGIIGWIIIILGIVGLILAGARVLFLSNASSTNDTLAKDALKKLLSDGTNEALKYLKPKKNATARVLKATIRNLDRDREHIEDIVAESILHESGRLDRFSSVIIVIAAVSPLLGLLGTVTGMIATFDIITEFGTGDPKLLSGGISIALVTTELGLIVAIPILMIGNLLGGWAERVKDNMEHSALHLINEYNKIH